MTATKEKKKKSPKKIMMLLLLLVIGMFGFGYLMVPIYSALCSVLGINGKTGGQAVAATTIDESRTIAVQFLSTNNADLNWTFYPKQKSVSIHPGQNIRISFFARNNTNKSMTVQAIPSVTPGLAAKHLKKTECFCFTQQTLKAHESRDMPLLFHLDNDLPKNIHELTLAYTLFDASKYAKKLPKNLTGHIRG